MMEPKQPDLIDVVAKLAGYPAPRPQPQNCRECQQWPCQCYKGHLNEDMRQERKGDTR